MGFHKASEGCTHAQREREGGRERYILTERGRGERQRHRQTDRQRHRDESERDRQRKLQ